MPRWTNVCSEDSQLFQYFIVQHDTQSKSCSVDLPVSGRNVLLELVSVLLSVDENAIVLRTMVSEEASDELMFVSVRRKREKVKFVLQARKSEAFVVIHKILSPSLL